MSVNVHSMVRKQMQVSLCGREAYLIDAGLVGRALQHDSYGQLPDEMQHET